ncbi:hypothetical protein CABS01_01920 [Colletotrichum abscissum]|nr:uncharacterized protein CABS01_01920 [Colletotrichum abscissum]KAK1496113.1 hypothetical protein CABS01_01920 [Colletotrichum abscissum]
MDCPICKLPTLVLDVDSWKDTSVVFPYSRPPLIRQ